MAGFAHQTRTESLSERELSTSNQSSPSLNLLSIAGDRHPQGASRHGRAANDEVLRVLKNEVDHPMGRTPEWVPREMRNPAPNVQCASTASNIYREAMLASHVIDSTNSPKYRELTQVQVPNWVRAMEQQGLAEEIPRDQIRPGDVVVGLGGVAGKPENNDRHIGFVGDYNERTHHYAAYSNAMGQLRLQDLDDRFGHYREEHFYRIYFPN
ncbi:MAG: hypothetical protein JST89_18950 [Cyanobacteria bacterium SZAS-4]|nr:hypothetical protein [Cyanobacteria bacterium SZAS-4]